MQTGYLKRTSPTSSVLARVIKTCIATMFVGFLVCANLRADLAFSPNGDLFALSSNEIFRYTADGTKSTFATLSKRPVSLAFDSTGNLFVADFGGSIFRFSPDGRKSTFVTGLKDAGNLACDAAGNLYVANDVESLILKFAPDKMKSTVATDVHAERMVLDPSGNLFVPAKGKDVVLRITSSGVKSAFVTEIEYADALAADSSGNLFVYGSPWTIFKITADGTKSAFVTNLEVSIPFSRCDRRGNLFFAEPNVDAILEFTPDGKKRELAVPHPNDMALDKGGNLFVEGPYAIFEFDPGGNKSTFASDRISPDKQWEYQCSDHGSEARIAKAGTNQLALDLSDVVSQSADEANPVWAPDSKRFALNYIAGPRDITTALYQLNGDKWVALDSPVDTIQEKLARAESAEKGRKSRSREAVRGHDSWTIERWIDADTAVLFVQPSGSYYLFTFTLKFHRDGTWKIVNQTKEIEEE